METIKTYSNNSYSIVDHYWTTNIFYFKNEKLLRIQNYKCNLERDYRIVEDKDFYYKVKGYVLYCASVQNIIDDIEKKDSCWILVVHKLVDNMIEDEKKKEEMKEKIKEEMKKEMEEKMKEMKEMKK